MAVKKKGSVTRKKITKKRLVEKKNSEKKKSGTKNTLAEENKERADSEERSESSNIAGNEDSAALEKIIEKIDEKGVASSLPDISEIVKSQLTNLMNKSGSDGARVSAAKSLMDMIYKQQESEGDGADDDKEQEREAAIADCARLLGELAARLSCRPVRKIAVA